MQRRVTGSSHGDKKKLCKRKKNGIKTLLEYGGMNMKESQEKNIVMDQGFVGDIRSIIDKARATAVRSVDFCRVQMYWNIGRRIFEEEQQGKERADYGTYLIKNLAAKIEPEYGSGFGIRQLERARSFYRVYPIASTVRTQLNWSQYKLLISIDDPDKRENRKRPIGGEIKTA